MDTRILTGGLLISLSSILGYHGLAKLITAYRVVDIVSWRRLAVLGAISVLSSATLADVGLADFASVATNRSSSTPPASPYSGRSSAPLGPPTGAMSGQRSR